MNCEMFAIQDLTFRALRKDNNFSDDQREGENKYLLCHIGHFDPIYM